MEEEIDLTSLQRRLQELEIRANGGSLWAAHQITAVIAAIVADTADAEGARVALLADELYGRKAA
jgi:hypothetical protein